MPVVGAQLPGLDLGALTSWLDGAAPGLRRGPLTASMITGGLSNLTFRVCDGKDAEDGGHVWALRRPPVAHTLPTAHDMAREFRVISALSPTTVPVPEPVLLCADPAVLGAPFYLMSFVDGVVLDRPEVLATLSPAAARLACEELVDTLLELHELDPVRNGLADLGHPDGFLARQVRRWSSQWAASRTGPDDHLAGLAETVATDLTRHLPGQSRAGLVHGDYRLTNLIYTQDVTAIAAVVDWELTTLGDPLADVGLLMVYQNLALAGDFTMPRTPGSAGFLSAEQLAERYAAGSRRDLAALDWYVAFGSFKLAVIAQGIHYRHVHGGSAGLGPGYADAGGWVLGLLEDARQRLSRLAG